MHVNCPHCHNGIEVVDESPLSDIDCPSCGSQFSLLGEDPHRTLSQSAVGRSVGRFQLVNEVGVGAFGSVWRGKDPQLDRTVAVKIPRKGQLNKEESEQFFREARAAAQLKHPNIVPVHEIGKDGETIYIVSDFVQGVSLADRLTAGPMGMREAAQLCIKVCRALHHAHEKGVIHRDLKPGNIMLDDHGQPHVMDFGLAKREAGEITMTVDGQILGTPAYMSPEQARGSAHDADGRSDIYSVGVILFQLLTGELPFRGNMRMLIHQVINEEAPSPLGLNSNIDKDLVTITTKCLEKASDKRYANANELADDLQRYLDAEPIVARPISDIERSWRWCKRKPALTGAIALSTLLLAILAIGGPIVAIQQAALRKQADEATEQSLEEKKRANDEAENARVAEAEAKQSAKRSSDVLRIVTRSFESTNPEKGSTAQMTAKDVLIRARENLKDSELDDLAKAELLYALATSFMGIGEHDFAISAAEESVALRTEKLGPDHPATLRSMNTLAVGYGEMGRNDEALMLQEKTLALQTEKLGPNHRETLYSMNNLATRYHAMGRTDKALELREKTVTLMTEKRGPANPDTLSSMYNLTLSYAAVGRTREALALGEKTFALQTEKLGPVHPDTLNSMNSLAISYRAAGRNKKALDLREKALELMTEKLGLTHPDTLDLIGNLAASYRAAGRNEEAVKLVEKALAVSTERLGPTHPSTLSSMTTLATIYSSAGRTEEALDLREKAFALMSEIDHPNILKTMNNLAISYRDAGRNEDGLILGEKTVTLMTEKLGPAHPDTLRSMSGLANSYHEAGRTEEALMLREKTLALATEKLGADHPSTLSGMYNLSLSYSAAGRTDEAIELQEKTLALRTETLGPNDRYTLKSMLGLVRRYEAVGRTEEALELQEKILAVRTETLGAAHPNTLISMNNVANRYLALGRTREALKLYEKTLRLRTEKFGPDHPQTLSSMKNQRIALGKAIHRVQDLIATAQFAKAEDLLNTIKGIEKLNKNQQKDFQQNLHVLQMAQQKHEDAQKTINDWMKLLDVNKRSDTSQIGWAKSSLAVCLLEQGLFSEAEEVANEALETEELTSTYRYRCQGVLGICLAHQQQFELAEDKVLAAWIELEQELNAIPPHLRWQVLRACERVMKVYELWDREKEVKKWQDKLNEAAAQIKKLNEATEAQNINNKVWNKVAKPPNDANPPLTDKELADMRLVCDEYPTGLYFNTLGVAEYRMGNFKEAIVAAEQSVEKQPKELNLPSAYPGDLAILALSHFKIGDTDKANDYRQQMTAGMKLDAFKDDAEAKSFAKEVTELLNVQPSDDRTDDN